MTFTEHIVKKKRKALGVIASLKELPLVSLDTAIRIYDMKVLPTVTYLIDLITPCMTLSQMRELDKVKASFVKKALGLHRSASSTLSLEIFSTGTMCEDLKRKNYVFDGETWKRYELEREEKLINLCIDNFTDGLCFNFDEWRLAGQKTRHFYIRFTAHGFHHRLCKFKDCYEAIDNCICV